jgi:hypothetical protein
MKVFQEFHRIAGRGCPFMDRIAEEDAFDEDDPVVSQLMLAQEMYRILIEVDADNHMYYVCCLFAALGSVSNEILSSLPGWLLDVVM